MCGTRRRAAPYTLQPTPYTLHLTPLSLASHTQPGFPAPETSGVWGSAAGGEEGHGEGVGKEFAGWAKPTLQVKHSGDGWDQSAAGRTAPPLQQSWHPNIIAFESSTRRPQLPADNSPYLAPLTAPTRTKRTAHPSHARV